MYLLHVLQRPFRVLDAEDLDGSRAAVDLHSRGDAKRCWLVDLNGHSFSTLELCRAEDGNSGFAVENKLQGAERGKVACRAEEQEEHVSCARAVVL